MRFCLFAEGQDAICCFRLRKLFFWFQGENGRQIIGLRESGRESGEAAEEMLFAQGFNMDAGALVLEGLGGWDVDFKVIGGMPHP